MLYFPGSLWQNVEFAASFRERPVHLRSVFCSTGIEQADVALRRMMDACFSSVTIAPSETKHYSAGLGVFARRTFQKGKGTRSYYGRLILHD